MTSWSWLSFWWGVAVCWLGFSILTLLLWRAAIWYDARHRRREIDRLIGFKG